MNAISEIKRLPKNVAEMESMFNSLISELDVCSDYQRAEILTYLNHIANLTEKIKKVPFIAETMQKLALDKFEVNGFRIEPHTATKYDYSSDPIWSELKAKITKREELMKIAGKGEVIFDDEGLQITPAIKTSSESFKFTAKK
jgi:hypothetical protein